MARIFIDGFETGDASLWEECSVPSAVKTHGSGSSMTGSYSVKGDSMSPIQFIKYVPNKTEYYLAFSVKPDAYSCASLCSFAYNTNAAISLTRTSDDVGVLHLRNGSDTGAIIGNSIATRGAPANKRSNIVFHIILGPAGSGSVDVTVNGKTSIALSGIDTNDAGPSINRIVLGSFSGTMLSSGYFDDVVLDDSEIPIRPRIIGLIPNSSGSYSQFTSSTGGPNYTCVDELPGSDDDFVLSNEISAMDTYNVTNLPAILTDVNCIQISARAWYEGNATARNISLISKSASGEVLSPAISLTNYPEGYSFLIQNNPATNNKYTADEINSLEIGIKTVD